MASAIGLAVLLVAGPAHGFDAASIDIIGLRLGMQEPEVVARLASQGYTVTHNADTVTANTVDGRLRVALSARHGVTEIMYVFNGRGAGEPPRLRAAVMGRFGNPNQANPQAWCLAVGQDGMCPKGQASLTFLPDSLTLLLQAETD